MKVKFFTPFIAIALVFSGMAQKAEAQSAFYPNCWYVSGYGGPAWHREMDVTFEITPTDPVEFFSTNHPLITDYRTGYTFGGAIGAVFCRNWRLEIEYSFRRFNGKRVVTNFDETIGCGQIGVCGCGGATINPSYNPSTHYRSFSLMLNGFYDFCLCESLSWYVGGGIGPSLVEYSVSPSGRVFTFRAQTHTIRFSYQILTGIAYKFCNNISVTAGYRLWGTTRKRHGNGSYSFFPTVTNYYNVNERRVPLVSSAEFGLRVAF